MSSMSDFIFSKSSEECKARSLTAGAMINGVKQDLKCRGGLRNWVAVIGMITFIVWVVYIITVTSTLEFTEIGEIRYKRNKDYKTMAIQYYGLIGIPYVVILFILLFLRLFFYISLSKYGDKEYGNKIKKGSDIVNNNIKFLTPNSCSVLGKNECNATYYEFDPLDRKKIFERNCKYDTSKNTCILDPQRSSVTSPEQYKNVMKNIKSKGCGTRNKDICEIDGYCKYKSKGCRKKFQWSEIGKGQSIFACDLCDEATSRCTFQGRSWVFGIVFFIFGILLIVFAGTLESQVDVDNSEKVIKAIEYSSYGLGGYYILIGLCFFFVGAYCPDGSNIRIGNSDTVYRFLFVTLIVIGFIIIIGSPILSLYL